MFQKIKNEHFRNDFWCKRKECWLMLRKSWRTLYSTWYCWLKCWPKTDTKIERFDRFYAPLCRGNMSQQLVSTSKTSFLKVLEVTKVVNYSFNGATNLQIINRVKNSRAKLNRNDIFRTIEMENVAKSLFSNYFFAI